MPTVSTRGGKLAYIDLYAGPGRYKNGAASTPLLVLQTAIDHPKLSQMLVACFNDADPNHAGALQAEIDKLAGIEKLRLKPQVTCGEIDEESAKYFSETSLIPAFSFVDPFGYKGLSSKILKGVIKDWGCDCVFFFNYSRINAGISNPVVTSHMDALFGRDRAEDLRAKLPDSLDLHCGSRRSSKNSPTRSSGSEGATSFPSPSVIRAGHAPRTS